MSTKRNKTIIIINIVAAFVLFFCCFFFFFQNMKMFLSDLKSYMAFFPILFFLGILMIFFYISLLVGKLENKKLSHADRFDIPYRIVFTCTLLMLVLRSFLGDFNGEGTILNVPIIIIVLAIASGLVTWMTPKIKDNDNNDF